MISKIRINKLSENARFKVLTANAIIAIAGIMLYAFSLRWTLGYDEEKYYTTLRVMLLIAPLMASILLAFIFFIMRPFQRYINRVKQNQAFDDKLYYRARRASLNLTKVLIFVNIFGFFIGPNIGFFISRSIITQDSIIEHFKNITLSTSMGFVTAIFAVFVTNILISKDKLLLKMTSIHKERREKDLGLKSKSFFLVFSIFLVAFVFSIFAGYNEYSVNEKLETALKNSSLSRGEIQSVIDETVNNRWKFTDFIMIYGPIFFALSIGIWFFYSKEQLWQLQFLKKRINNILEGDKDLTQKLNLLCFDEVGELAALINQFIEKIRQMFHEIKTVFGEVQSSESSMENNFQNSLQTTKEITGSVTEVSRIVERQVDLVNNSNEILTNVLESFQDVVVNVEKQSTSMQSTSTVIEEVASNIASVTHSSALADQLAKKLNQAAQAGNHAVEDSVESITLVENLSDKVEEIITVITNVAEQTDMLAMNAAIEAAHAGEFGKGFAVVAEEIRKLAEDSSSSAKEIVSQIKEMGINIRRSVDLSQLAGDSLGNIVADVKQTSHLIREISFAMGEQNQATQNILSAISELVESNEKIRLFTNQEKSSNEKVIESMKELVKVTEDVMAIIHTQNSMSEQIINNVENIDDSWKKNKQAIRDYSKLIDEFKL